MLDLQGLVKTFHPGTENEVRALQGVDLLVEEGSFVVVIGTNGSGKSTLQNAVSGSFLVDSGSIRLAGRDITRWPEVYRKIRAAGKLIQIFPGQAPRGWDALEIIADQIGSAKGIIMIAGGAMEDADKAMRLLARFS